MSRELIVKRVAKELKDGDVVNLGIGVPTMVANYIPEDMDVTFQSENGFLGLGPAPEAGNEDPLIVNAGGQPVSIKPGGTFFDSATSFMLIRGGHVDVTVLGALQVDEEGNLANWMIPGKMVPGMGGAMDLVAGVGRVVVVMDHNSKHGESKVLKACTLPLTGKGVVNRIISNLGVLDVVPGGLKIVELADGVTEADLRAATDATIVG